MKYQLAAIIIGVIRNRFLLRLHCLLKLLYIPFIPALSTFIIMSRLLLTSEWVNIVGV